MSRIFLLLKNTISISLWARIRNSAEWTKKAMKKRFSFVLKDIFCKFLKYQNKIKKKTTCQSYKTLKIVRLQKKWLFSKKLDRKVFYVLQIQFFTEVKLHNRICKFYRIDTAVASQVFERTRTLLDSRFWKKRMKWKKHPIIEFNS